MALGHTLELDPQDFWTHICVGWGVILGLGKVPCLPLKLERYGGRRDEELLNGHICFEMLI